MLRLYIQINNSPIVNKCQYDLSYACYRNSIAHQKQILKEKVKYSMI